VIDQYALQGTGTPKIMWFKLTMLTILLLAGDFSHACGQAQTTPVKASARTSSQAPQTYTHEGVSVEFSITPLSSDRREVVAGTEATVRFRIRDTNGGKALSSLRPAVWIDRRSAAEVSAARECREKIQSFLQPSFNRRANIDLNSYFILALNHEPNISVIDPLFGFGGSKLYALVPLRSTGEDWVMSAGKKRLYVSMPAINQVAVIDTADWKASAHIDAGARPTRVALQHDEKYLWIGNDDAQGKGSGVTVIDTTTLKVAARFETGAGHHEIAFTEDDRFAFITNKLDGTISVIDVRNLAKVKDIKLGGRPVSLAFSPLSKALYVVNEDDGTIFAIDTLKMEIVARMKAKPGLRTIRMLPDSRFGFVVNQAANEVYIFDASTNRLRYSVPVEPGADQISFTREFAYVRAPGSEYVTMIKVTDLDKNQEVAITRFPAGQKAPRESPANSLADAIVPAPGDGSVLVASPADKMIYFYTEGMAAPMGSFQNYRRDPKALLVLNNSLAETAGGVYTATVRLPEAGSYDVAFLLDNPRLVNCFDISVAENPDLPKVATVPIKIQPMLSEATARVGESYVLRFKVLDKDSDQPRANLEDVGTLVFLSPGIWQQRELAKALGNGVYEITFVPPQAGVYYVFFQSPSLDVRFNQLPSLTITAIKK
jgi:YVTN family beta-propeller protein